MGEDRVKSPLEQDISLKKEFGIRDENDLDDVFKLSYVRSQIEEFKKVIYRNRVDAIISQDLIERAKKDKNEALEQKGRENYSNYRNVIKQMTGAVEVMEALKKELESLVESPESN
jgi:vancomycin resistance protein YoaR